MPLASSTVPGASCTTRSVNTGSTGTGSGVTVPEGESLVTRTWPDEVLATGEGSDDADVRPAVVSLAGAAPAPAVQPERATAASTARSGPTLRPSMMTTPSPRPHETTASG